ncbi:SKY-like protein, partial [Mya arenaria]
MSSCMSWLKKKSHWRKKDSCKECAMVRQRSLHFKEGDMFLRNSNFKAGFHDCKLYAVWTWLPTRYAVCQPELLFTTEEHGTSLVTLYQRVENYQPTIIVIKTTKDE